MCKCQDIFQSGYSNGLVRNSNRLITLIDSLYLKVSLLSKALAVQSVTGLYLHSVIKSLMITWQVIVDSETEVKTLTGIASLLEDLWMKSMKVDYF